MNQLFLGSSGSGITNSVKKMISNLSDKVIILDFNNEYEDIDGNVIFLDKVNPLFGQISIDDVKAMNAGYLGSSRCLFNKAKEVLKECGLEKKENLVEESVERLQISWDNAENMYGKLLNQKMPIKKNRAHICCDRIIEEILEHKITILKAKNMHSDNLRGVAFAVLSRLSRHCDEKITVISDELVSFFAQGNNRMFFESINFDNIGFVFCYNKASTVPKEVMNLVDVLHIHRINSPAELKIIKELGIDTQKDIRKLEDDACVIIEKKELLQTM